MQEPDELLDEAQAARLIQAAMSAPSHPLRADQIDTLVRTAEKRLQPVFPLWAVLVYAGGLLALILFGAQSGWPVGSLLDLAWLLPLVNVALSPLAAFLIIYRIRSNKKETEGNQ